MKTQELLIEPQELVPNLGRSDWVVIDCRANLTDHEWGRQQYELSHIPSAQFADLETDLSGYAGVRGRHPLPTRLNFWGFVRANGIDNHTQVVAYDDRNSAYATRFWWLMRWLGHKRTRVLNGGLENWRRHKFPETATVVKPPRGTFTLRSPLVREIKMEVIDGAAQTLVDARTVERFNGIEEPIDHTAGHIPGAICMPFTANLNEDGTFRTNPRHFAKLTEEQDIVCYCGSGVTATHNIFSMLLADLHEPRLYAGSWSEWIEHRQNPIATND